MAGKRRLKSQAPRLLTDHRSYEGRRYRALFDALSADYGPFVSQTVRNQAGLVAMSWLQFEIVSKELDYLQRARRVGRGRKPNLQQCERLSRRAGINKESYEASLSKLIELAKRQQHGRDLARVLMSEHEAQA
jgi:hypothetical protein